MRRGRIDAIAAALLLAILSPLLLVLIVLDLMIDGRAIYRQVRAGQELRPFPLLKLATMREGRDARMTVTVAGDPRTTRFGRFLRAWKLNELPQLVNVIRGDIRFVGPRPLPLDEIARLPRGLAEEVYRVPPGLTGIGSLGFIDEEGILARSSDPEREYFERVLPAKMQLELAYARRRTLGTDLALVLLTPVAVVLPAAGRALLRRLHPDADEALRRAD